jgi:chromosomal replication initiation ATPase DnaA
MNAYTTKWPTAVEGSRVSERQRKAARDIIDQVSRKHGVSQRDVMSRSRLPSIVAARQEAMRLVHSTGLKLGQVGLIFKRDHSTVLTNIRRAEARINQKEQHNV